jgi:D-alanyl-D-alanine carboxypeptidase
MKNKLLLLPYLLISISVFGQANYYKRKIDKLLAQPSQTPFNGVILITRNGKPQYQKIVGYSDLENKRPICDRFYQQTNHWFTRHAGV